MRHKNQHVDHQDNHDLYKTLHPCSPLGPKGRLVALLSLLSDLFFRPLGGFYGNPRSDSSQRSARGPAKGLIGLIPLVFVRIECEFRVGDLDEVVHSDPQYDDEAKQGYKTDRQRVNFKNGFFHWLGMQVRGRR